MVIGRTLAAVSLLATTAVPGPSAARAAAVTVAPPGDRKSVV